jgi:N-acetylglucosaminyl-diphospho-decaprenol L-rhamnosyltransferase
MPSNSLVSVLIVSFNTKALTLACLHSVLHETKVNTEVIVVDNASHDGSADAIEEQYPEIKLIRSSTNTGFGPANNVAAKHSKSDYVLLLNSDTVVLDAAIDRLVAFAKVHPEAMIWGGRTLFEDRSLNPSSCWRHMSLWSLFCHATGLTSIFKKSDIFNPEAYGSWPRDSQREVDFVSGCFLLTTRAMWERLEGFDERFFMYAEEADLCKRATYLGARPMVTPEATIIHYGGKSEKAREDKLIKLFAGRMTFALKHWSPLRVKCAQWLMVLHCGLRSFAELAGYRVKSAGSSSMPWFGVMRQRARWMNGYLDRKP